MCARTLARYRGLAMMENPNEPVTHNGDRDLYREHIQALTTALEPVGAIESHLVQRIADTEWRLKRITILEMGIYEMGRIDFADFFASYDEPTRDQLIRAKTYLFYQKEFAKLSLQESRLRKYLERDMNELKALQCHRAPRNPEQNTPAKWPAPWPASVKESKSKKKDPDAPVWVPELTFSRPRLPEDPPDIEESEPGFVVASRVGGYYYHPNKTAA